MHIYILSLPFRQEEAPETTQENLELTLRDEVRRLNPIKLSHKPKSLHLVLGNGGELRVVVTLTNNTLELFTISTTVKGSEAKCLRSITQQGHHSEVRAVSFSSDNLAIVSGSAESIKLWNRPSQTCLRTVETGYVLEPTGYLIFFFKLIFHFRYVLSTIFVPGDRHIIAGLKDGKVLIVDIASGDVLEEIQAHTSEVWSICLQTDLVSKNLAE